MALKTHRFDVEDHLKSSEDRAAYLAAAFKEGDSELIIQALNDIARAVGMAEVAKAAGVTREGLYRSLGENGDPKLSTSLGVMHALSVKLSATAAN